MKVGLALLRNLITTQHTYFLHNMPAAATISFGQFHHLDPNDVNLQISPVYRNVIM